MATTIQCLRTLSHLIVSGYFILLTNQFIGIASSGIRTNKYAKIPKSILHPSNSHDGHVDGDTVEVRALETNDSPFRRDNHSLGSIKKTHLAQKPAGAGRISAFASRPISNLN